MSAIKCDLYRINFAKKDLEEVLLTLLLLDNFEPVSPLFEYEDQDLKKKQKSFNQKYESLKKDTQFLLSFIPKSKNKLSQKPQITQKALENLGQNSSLESIITKTQNYQENYDSLEKKLTEYQKKLQEFEPLKKVDAKIASETTLFKTKILKMDVNVYENIRQDLEENELISLKVLAGREKMKYVLVVYDEVAWKVIDEIVKKKSLSEIEFTTKKPTSCKKYYQRLSKKLARTQKELDRLSDDIRKFAEESLEDIQLKTDVFKLKSKALDLVKYVGYSFGKGYDHTPEEIHVDDLKALFHKNELIKGHVETKSFVHIDGWVLPHKAEELTKAMQKINREVEVLRLDREKLSEGRSGLSNKKIFRPFETITGLMGIPGSDEIDPSPFVAPFFIAFFGFALGDAGYGLVIALASIYALLKIKLDETARNGIWLMLYCGISTVFFGTLTGGWFGADLEAIGAVGKFLAQFKVFDVASNIILVLLGSLAIGFLHQILGLILSMYAKIKNKKYAQALWQPGTWILLLLSVVFYALKDVLPQILQLPWGWIVVFTLFLFAWGQGYGTKNVLLRPLKGASGIFGITSYLSNTLSYARLLALALATSVIASVVNLLAVLFSGDIPVLSFIIASVILVLGHAFNLILNLVGTFINVVRLHLVEFFPRFYDAKGIPIQPLKFDPDYTIIDKNSLVLDFAHNHK